MKKIIFLCLVVFLTPTLLFSQQIKLINKTVSDKNSRTLYIGVDNELEVQCETFKGVLPKEGVFLKQNNIKVRPTTVGNFTIVFLTNDGENPISFDVVRVADPIPVFAGQSDNQIINKSLLNQSQLTIKSSHNQNNFFENYKVVSFIAKLNGTNYEVTGNSFSSELTSAIANSKTDDLLAISDVRGYNEEISKSINIKGNFSFKIK
jgi:GldM C-terminal domain